MNFDSSIWYDYLFDEMIFLDIDSHLLRDDRMVWPTLFPKRQKLTFLFLIKQSLWLITYLRVWTSKKNQRQSMSLQDMSYKKLVLRY